MLDRYEAFVGSPGFPNVYWYGWHDEYKVMALELLGPSLDDLFVYSGHRPSLKTALMLMDQHLTRFETIYSRGLLHRYIKPQNCLLEAQGFRMLPMPQFC